MISYKRPGSVVITCQRRLSSFLAQEITNLGFDITEQFLTGVKLNATLEDCIKLNLRLRCASQILYSLKQFTAADADDVYKVVKSMTWETMLPINAHLTVTSNVANDTINNSMFANVRVKDAIVDRMRTKTKHRPETSSEPVSSVIHLHWKEEEAEIFLDTSGHSLARHGYRKIPGQAPMLEALASASIMATNWNHTAPLLNPMCGSGTLAIEAALIATNRAPGLYRDNYSFMHFKGYDNSFYEKELASIQSEIHDQKKLKIYASDHSKEAIKNAKLNAEAADVLDYIVFEHCDFAESTIPDIENGVIIMNPEYGLRLGELDELEETYKRIGDFLKQKCAGYTGYIFTGNLELAKKIGLKPKRRIEFFNSTIDCRLLMFELYKGTRREITT